MLHVILYSLACRFHRYLDITEPMGALPWEVEIRFGRWEEILVRPLPANPAVACVTTAVARYARGLAFSALGRVDEAEDEQRAFETAVARVPSTRLIHMVSSHESLAIAQMVLRGELAYRRQDFEVAFESLRTAVRLDDALPYDEPWGWKIPARHALGALLLERATEASRDEGLASVKDRSAGGGTSEAAALMAESEAVFRADLQRYPNNLWSLTGLKACLSRRAGADAASNVVEPKLQSLPSNAELDEVAARLARAVRECDVDVRHACFCAGRQSRCNHNEKGGGSCHSQQPKM